MTRTCSFQLDYTPAGGWLGWSTDPEGWGCQVTGDTADATCAAAAAAAQRQFGRECTVAFTYTSAGWRQAGHEETEHPDRLACPLCNPDHPDHDRAVKAAAAAHN